MHTKSISSLALQVAQALDDMQSLPLHEKFVRDFPAKTIQKNLAIALSYPEEEVKVSRGAIYTSLMNASRYGRNTRYQSRR